MSLMMILSQESSRKMEDERYKTITHDEKLLKQ